MYKKIVIHCAALALLSGCDVHLTERDAWECLKSERLNFHDPESVSLMANLAGRGQPIADGTFWIRYKAKNGFGAYGQANMACTKTSDGWKRGRVEESVAVERVTQKHLQRSIERLKAGERDVPSAEMARRTAEAEVFESAGHLQF